MTTVSVPSVDFARLRHSSSLELVMPDDPAFDAARTAWNSLYQHAPLAIARPSSAAAVAEVVTFARDHAIPVGIQATGHGPTRTSDGAILLDLSQLSSVHVDPERHRVVIGGGAKWQAVLDATAPHGLAPLLGSTPDVGAVGYTLGGGLGWLARKYGSCAESVHRFELVTADGSFVQASADRDPELFWALRGGGAGHLGVVTEMELELFPHAELHGGSLFYTAELALEVVRRWRDWVADLSDDMTSAVTLMNFPPVEEVPAELRGASFAIVRGAHLGSADAAESALEHWRAWRTPMIDTFSQMPFGRIAEISQDPLDPMPFVGRGLWIRRLSDTSIDRLVATTFSGDGPPILAFSELRHTASSRQPDPGSLTALTQADASMLLALVAVTPTAEARLMAEQELDRVEVSVQADLTGRHYLNFIEGDRRRYGAERASGADAVDRLAAVKRRLDPHGLFDRGLDVGA